MGPTPPTTTVLTLPTEPPDDDPHPHDPHPHLPGTVIVDSLLTSLPEATPAAVKTFVAQPSGDGVMLAIASWLSLEVVFWVFSLYVHVVCYRLKSTDHIFHAVAAPAHTVRLGFYREWRPRTILLGGRGGGAGCGLHRSTNAVHR